MTNEINNKNIIENIINSTWTLLKSNENYLNKENFSYKFGYCVKGSDNQIEALFKVKTDKNIFYFQAIKGKIYRLDINEETFNYSVNIFYENNPSLFKKMRFLLNKKLIKF